MLLQGLSKSNLFDSFREMERLQGQLNRLFDGYLYRAGACEYPPLNVWTAEDKAVVTAEVPGIAPENIDISVINETLILKGSRESEALVEGQNWHRRERGYGEFARTIQLPFKVEAEQVEAVFKNGILQITLPRAEADKPRKITVKAQ
jgi:HSP20 family protein